MNLEPRRNKYIGHRYVPKIFGEWSKDYIYEGLSIVTYKGESYTSKKHVPKGVDILNEEYWVLTGNYNAQVTHYRDEVLKTKNELNKNMDSLKKDVSDDVTELNKNMDSFKKDVSDDVTDFKKNVNNDFYDLNKRNGTYSKHNKKGYMVILDDDTRKQSYDVLYPYAKKNNVKITLGAISGRILADNTSHISYDEFLEMRDSGIVEYVNHTHTHPRLYGLSDQQLEDEILQCQNFLTENGIFTKHFVYPYGEVDNRIKSIVANHLHSGSKSNGLAIRTDNKINDMYELNRMVFEEELSTFENRINNISEHGGLIIINTHSAYETFNTEKLNTIINMAKNKDIEIVHMSEALEKISNAIEIRDEENNLIGGVSHTGYTEGIFTKDTLFKNYYKFDVNDPPDVYETQKITMSLISNDMVNNLGWPVAGQLKTFRFSNDDFTYQELTPFRSTKTLKRYWNTTSESWSDWFTIKTTENDTPVSQTFSNISLEPGKWTNLRVENDRFKVGDTIAFSYDTSLPNLVTITTGLIATNGSVMFRLINLSDTDTYNIEDITFYVKKV